MPIYQRDPEHVEQLEIVLPEQPNGANTLFVVTGRVSLRELEAGEGAREGTFPSNSYVFLAGPELAPEQIRSVRATAAVTSVYAAVFIPATPPAGPSDFMWTLGSVDAVHDDDARKARVTVAASVLARFQGFVRIQEISFELRIMARR